MATKGPKPVWMSARQKVNQSRPRALAPAAASCATGAVCFAAADDAKPASARRPSQPPSNSSASADSPMSPAPSGKYGVGFGRVPRAIGPPLVSSGALYRAKPEQDVAVVLTGYSESAKAAILRSNA